MEFGALDGGRASPFVSPRCSTSEQAFARHLSEHYQRATLQSRMAVLKQTVKVTGLRKTSTLWVGIGILCTAFTLLMTGIIDSSVPLDMVTDSSSWRKDMEEAVEAMSLPPLRVTLMQPANKVLEVQPLEGEVPVSPANNLWQSSASHVWRPCANDTLLPSLPGEEPRASFKSNGYLLVGLAGGLNQMRSGICDAVAVARLLNATLLVPILDKNSWWSDKSDFRDVFDEDHFIDTLRDDVKVIRKLPPHVKRGRELSRTVPRKASAAYYLSTILPLLRKKVVVKINHFDFRLSDHLPAHLQMLRCRANYHALRFAAPVKSLAEVLVSKARAGGPFIAVHLRYEPDMLAFTGCDYGGGAKEQAELHALRKRWKNLPTMDPARQRHKGACVYTPQQVGMALKLLGYPKSTHVYIASGPLYGGPSALEPLRALYPKLETKQELAPAGTLGLHEGHASQLAAIDYAVCELSDVFVSNNNGNMARMLAGHRRYMGQKISIRLFGSGVEDLLEKAEAGDSNAHRKLKHKFLRHSTEKDAVGGFYSNPFECICRQEPLHRPS